MMRHCGFRPLGPAMILAALALMLLPGTGAFLLPATSPHFAGLVLGHSRRPQLTLMRPQPTLRSRRAFTSPAMHVSTALAPVTSSLAIVENVGMLLPACWFKQLGTPSPYPLHVALFLITNFSYFFFAAKIAKKEPRRGKWPLVFAMCLAGCVSMVFHSAQCTLGTAAHAVHGLCLMDTVAACCSSIVFLLCCRRILVSPSLLQVIGWTFSFLLLANTGGFYTTTHGLWHLTSSWLAYKMVEENALLDTSLATRQPLPYLPAAALPRLVGDFCSRAVSLELVAKCRSFLLNKVPQIAGQTAGMASVKVYASMKLPVRTKV